LLLEQGRKTSNFLIKVLKISNITVCDLEPAQFQFSLYLFSKLAGT